MGVVARRADPDALVEALRWMDANDSFGVVPAEERPRLVTIDEMCEELFSVYAGVLEAQDSQASSSASAEASQE